MGVLANHVPSIEQLKPGVVEVVEESGGAKLFFRTSSPIRYISLIRGHEMRQKHKTEKANAMQLLVDSLPSSPTPS